MGMIERMNVWMNTEYIVQYTYKGWETEDVDKDKKERRHTLFYFIDN